LLDFSTIGRHTFWGKLLRIPLRAIPEGLSLPILQGALFGNWWVVGSSVPGCWLGYYERDKQKCFADAVGPGSVVIDIGANAGFYTLLAAVRSAPMGEVVAFEPLPRNVDYLNRHIRLNRLSNVRVVQAAVADFVGQARFAEHAHPEEGSLCDSGQLVVRVVSLDALYGAGEIVKPNIVKIDVEGAELAVLQGARLLLAEARPTIFLATHGAGVHQDCSALLR
jgi:FkbM family methyltransferase